MLLPNSSSKFEVDIANLFVQFSEDVLKVENVFDSEKQIPIRYLWDIERCQSEFLPFLAQALGVDLSILNFSDSQIRNVLKASFRIHQIKGTVGSIVQLIESLGYRVTQIDEGTRDMDSDNHLSHWALYRVHIETPIPAAYGPALTELIKGYAPTRCKLEEIFFTNSHQYNGTILYDGTYTYGSITT